MSDEDPPAIVNNHNNCTLATVHRNPISAIPSIVQVRAGRRRKSVAIIFVIIATVLIIATAITLPIVLVGRNSTVTLEETASMTNTTFEIEANRTTSMAETRTASTAETTTTTAVSTASITTTITKALTASIASTAETTTTTAASTASITETTTTITKALTASIAEITTTTKEPATTNKSNRFNITFAEQKSYSTGIGALPVALAVVDVNNDKKPDIIVANQYGFYISVLLNMGDGAFSSITNYPTRPGSHPQFVSVVDINGDDRPDIIVANNGGNGVGVFFNFGNGTFDSQWFYSTGPATYPPSLTVADFNGDKKRDIIVTNQNDNSIFVFFNLGNGTFGTRQKYQLPDGTGPTSPSVADINGDSKPEIIFASNSLNTVTIIFTYTKTFDSVNYDTGSGSQPAFLSVVDVNQDDKLDIVVANSNTHHVGIFLNSGNGTFFSQMNYSTGNNSNPRCVSVVDINGDNLPDIIVANHNDNNIGILVNIGNGTFILEKILSTGPYSAPRFVSVVDVNGDAKPDIIVANSNTSSIGVMLAS